MATSKEYFNFICEQLSGIEDISYKTMMGEYIVYFNGKIVGGIYDDRLLVKDVASARGYMKALSYELPYDGAKPMLLVDDVDDSEYIAGLFRTVYEELPSARRKTLDKKDCG